MELAFEPADWPWRERVAERAAPALARLGWAAWPGRLLLAVDAPDADHRLWFRFAPGEIVLHVHPRHFARPGGGEASPPWEMNGPEDPETAPAPPAWSAAETDVFLHRQLLALRDLRDGVLRPADVPPARAAAVQEVWDVTIDGRLARRGWPGLPLDRRRRLFARRFAVGGELLPRHWTVFRRLWEWETPDHAGLVAAAAELPPPG